MYVQHAVWVFFKIGFCWRSLRLPFYFAPPSVMFASNLWKCYTNSVKVLLKYCERWLLAGALNMKIFRNVQKRSHSPSIIRIPNK